MRKIVLTFLMFMLCYQLKAQDYIVINGKDTIACKINEVGSQKIFFTITTDGVPYPQSLLLSQVTNYYFNHTNEQPEKKSRFGKNELSSTFENTLRVNLSYGLGYLVGENTEKDEVLKDHINELRTGTNISLDVHYFPGKLNYGLGVKFSRFNTSNEVSQFPFLADNGTNQIGLMRDDITMNYIGGSLIMRWLKDNNVSGFYFDIAFGRSLYTNKAELGRRFKLDAAQFSINTALNYDFKLNDYFALGLGLEYNWVNFDAFEVNGREIEVDETIGATSRINMQIGIRALVH